MFPRLWERIPSLHGTKSKEIGTKSKEMGTKSKSFSFRESGLFKGLHAIFSKATRDPVSGLLKNIWAVQYKAGASLSSLGGREGDWREWGNGTSGWTDRGRVARF